MDNLRDLVLKASDPEKQRVEEEKYLNQVVEVLSRPLSGPNAPTDKGLLTLIENMACFYSEFQLGEGYDDLIERLSFTAREIEPVGKGELKTGWTKFLDNNEVNFIWPLNAGMAEWYEEHKMEFCAIAVYEHMYSFYRKGELLKEIGDDESLYNMLEDCLNRLMYLCCKRNLLQRARHICEIIEDFYLDGNVSIEAYTNTLPLLYELNHASIGQQIESDRLETKNRLEKDEYSPLLDRLHGRTKYLIVEAELWSKDHWRNVMPSVAPLLWAQVIESEFHQKVYRLHKEKGLQAILEDRAPKRDQTCRLGPMIEILTKAGASNNPGLKIILNGVHDGSSLTSSETIRKLKILFDHRNNVAHVREKEEKAYTSNQCSDFLKEIRETGWVFKFLEALQPRDGSARN